METARICSRHRPGKISMMFGSPPRVPFFQASNGYSQIRSLLPGKVGWHRHLDFWPTPAATRWFHRWPSIGYANGHDDRSVALGRGARNGADTMRLNVEDGCGKKSVKPPALFSPLGLGLRVSPASALTAMLFLSACEDRSSDVSRIVAGNAERGRALMQSYGCGACHTVSGIQGANGVVGPPLTHFARRAFIAGTYPNRPSTVVRWIQNPPAMAPLTAMPDMGVSEAEATDIAAFLFEQH